MRAYPSRPDLTLGVGDAVRSFDFPGRDDCYLDGVITGVVTLDGCPRYALRVDSAHYADQPDPQPPGPYVYPPVNGTLSWLGGVTRGVARLPDGPGPGHLRHQRGAYTTLRYEGRVPHGRSACTGEASDWEPDAFGYTDWDDYHLDVYGA